MTPYIAFKRALIDGCLTCPVTRIAEMIMIDVGLPHQKIVSNWPDYDAINKFIISMNMPRMYGKEMVSVYLASYYPMTYNAFLDGKPKEYLYRLIAKEKKRKNGMESNPFVKEKHSYERTKDSRVRRLRMRSLSKAHDWNTVK
tara:strand:+ start:323 stop:751 length:429 start_codon:yes stop_codon:yes gene_type:complete